LFPLFASALVWTAWARKQRRDAADTAFGISEAGVRLVDSNTLIPWDQIRSVWHSKAFGLIVVRSPLLDGRYVISRKAQNDREDGAFEKAAALIKKSIASGRWRESWL
jgi:hypothetical protein